MNEEMKKNIGLVILGAGVMFSGSELAGAPQYAIEDATQVVRLAGEYETVFYMVKERDDMVVVGYETTDPAKIGQDPREYYDEKVLEAKELPDENTQN